MAFQSDSIYWVEVEKVVPNPFQPRREFDEQKLRELGESIRMYGVLQPLTVTRREVQREDGTFYSEYELIAGERRLRASKLMNIPQVPVIIRDGEQSEQEKLELAIIENLQREDLNAVDRALAFRQLADQFKLSHAQVAEKVGRSREYVSNSIRLLALPENILEALKVGTVTEGHARTLLMLNDRPEEQQVVFEEAVLKKLSVRDVEKIARGIATDKIRKKTLQSQDSELIEIEKKFTESLGTRVQIHKTEFGGRVAIDYFTVEDLEAILERIKIEEKEAAASESELEKLIAHTPLMTQSAAMSAVVSEPLQEPVQPAERDSESTQNSVPMPVEHPVQAEEAVQDIPQESEVPRSSMSEVVSSFASAFRVHEEQNEVPSVPEVTVTPDFSHKQEDEQPVKVENAPLVDETQTEATSPTANPVSELAPQERHEEPAPEVSEEKHDDKSDQDDSDLYSIRRFTV